MAGVGAAFAWYTEEDCLRLRSLMADAEDMHDTFAEWHESAQAVVETVLAQGLTIRRVYITDAFFTWCKDKKLRADGKARSQFTSEQAEEQDRIWGDLGP
jgi:hypothetical protein